MADDKEARIEKLEIDLAHALNTIDELNTVVFDQGRQLDRLNPARHQHDGPGHGTDGERSARPPDRKAAALLIFDEGRYLIALLRHTSGQPLRAGILI